MKYNPENPLEGHNRKIVVDAEGTAKIESVDEKDREYLEEMWRIQTDSALTSEQVETLIKEAQDRWSEGGTKRTRRKLPELKSESAQRIKKELEKKQREWRERRDVNS